MEVPSWRCSTRPENARAHAVMRRGRLTGTLNTDQESAGVATSGMNWRCITKQLTYYNSCCVRQRQSKETKLVEVGLLISNHCKIARHQNNLYETGTTEPPPLNSAPPLNHSTTTQLTTQLNSHNLHLHHHTTQPTPTAPSPATLTCTQ